jgi:hypothetical protein
VLAVLFSKLSFLGQYVLQLTLIPILNRYNQQIEPSLSAWRHFGINDSLILDDSLFKCLI